jgi:hypothetical protein
MAIRRFRSGFAASDHALYLLKSHGVNQNNILLFGCGIEEVAGHTVILARLLKPYGYVNRLSGSIVVEMFLPNNFHLKHN